jgi:hypothetical protein
LAAGTENRRKNRSERTEILQAVYDLGIKVASEPVPYSRIQITATEIELHPVNGRSNIPQVTTGRLKLQNPLGRGRETR